ncbi:adenylyl-sulfate kinase [Desulfovulcanus ferrireducens]|uniref:adenylyl-sulfate kinase n=1 Tax=Desulfovulcanus ferrireducens TaxID=2831190 RepID=UPI00207B98E0|nr:adenylyl-sulfate kinase [Desulfovulcanus ferrireducens]
MKNNSTSNIQHSTLNIVWHNGYVKRADRNRLNKHKSGLIWFTGLSASGKSTIAHLVEKKLHEQGIRTYVLDGDNVRHGLNVDLGFSREDRKENLRRIVEVCKLMVDAGLVVLTAFISPYNEDRAYVRSKLNDDYIEIYVKCSVEECERRDPKGLYKKARAGIIKNYTGISAPYEVPDNPDLVIDTEHCDPEKAAVLVLEFLKSRDFLRFRN